jgi:hypothetical protein
MKKPATLQEIAEEARRAGKTGDKVVCTRTVRRWIASGVLKARKLAAGWIVEDWEGFQPPTPGGRSGAPPREET